MSDRGEAKEKGKNDHSPGTTTIVTINLVDNSACSAEVEGAGAIAKERRPREARGGKMSVRLTLGRCKQGLTH